MRTLPILSALVLLCCAPQLQANPVGIDVTGAFRDAVQGVIEGGPAQSDSVFVQLLGGDNIRFMRDDIWESLDAQFERFAPLFVQAQSPPYVIRDDILAWYWERADESQREAMLRGLRTWLTAALDDSVHYTKWGVRVRPRDERGRVLERVNAAEFLVDYHDEAALPLIEALRDSIESRSGGLQKMPGGWVEVWWYLHQAAMRMEHPEQAVLCTPTDSGGLQISARAQDIAVARYVPFFVDSHPEMPVTRAAAAQVMDLLRGGTVVGQCRERRRAPCSHRNDGMMIQMSDGRELTLSSEADDVVLCSDNTRYFRWAYKVRQPELQSMLEEMESAFAAEARRYPSGWSDVPTAMPN